MPTKKPKKLTDVHPNYASRSRTGCRGERGLLATAPTGCQPLSRFWNSSQLPPNQRHIHFVEVKYCEDTRPRSQLEAAHHQHGVLCQHLRRAAANVNLHSILLGVGGTIYSPNSLEPLNPQKATKLAEKLHAHSVQYAYKLVSTRHALEKIYATNHHQAQEWGTSSHLRDPH